MPQTARQAEMSGLQSEELLREARRIIQSEAAALVRMANQLDHGFTHAVQLILQTTGCVIVTGVGKAGLIGRKIVATLASTGTRSHFLHPTEARHGDLGCLAPNDLVLALSNSGESEEIVSLLPSLQRLQIPVIALTRNSANTLARAATVLLEFGRHDEAGQLGLAPSTSTTAMLAMGDALALVVSQRRGFTADQFSIFHPAGSLGRQLCPVRDVMRKGSQVRIAAESETVRDVMIHLSRPGRR
ncbi:MAG: Arabinose 5-phosphate isomerase KdsD, partial [Planctomycetota bacterium]